LSLYKEWEIIVEEILEVTTKKIRIEEEINYQKGDDYNFDYDEFR